MSSAIDAELPRVAVLPPHLADQIAAGEVVERPASIVRELVDNAIDAGARRIEIEVRGGGTEGIVVVDDGHGIHPDDLELAVTRHATSKLRRAADLVDIATLGFRGEALASVAAVARVSIRSRCPGARGGHAIDVGPGRPPRRFAVGMPPGTRVEVGELFATVPARRKFLRGEATELGHITDTVLRAALVHPEVAFVLRTVGRTLLELPAVAEDRRMHDVLRRRGGDAPIERIGGEHGGTVVDAWVLLGEGAARAGQGVFVIVRRRVVRERHLTRLFGTSIASRLPEGAHPIGCIKVEPPPGMVDVNVHPQKAEIRFSDAQAIYANVRQVLAQLEIAEEPPPIVASPPAADRTAIDDAVARWAARAEPVAPAAAGSYRLRTQAAGSGWIDHRRDVRAGADRLHADRLHDAPRSDPDRWPDAPRSPADSSSSSVDAPPEDGPLYLACLPGPVGLFRDGDALLAVDLRSLRAHLLHRRLRDELSRTDGANGRGGAGVPAQALLTPAVISLSPTDVACVRHGIDALSKLGLVVEPFGDDAVIVRAVPATLRGCIEEPDAAELVTRVLPWLRLRMPTRATTRTTDADASDLDDAMIAIAQSGPDPAPRLARRWIRELHERGEPLHRVPGVRRWSAAALCGRDE